MAIAASAGGLDAITQVLQGLPIAFPAAIVIVQHLSPDHPSLMAEILQRYTLLPVRQAQDGMGLQPRTVYVAPPDRHLLVTPEGRLSLTHTARVHFVRPSADALFESVATSYPGQAIAVVLSGTGKDGSQGVVAIKQTGGLIIAQDKATAEFFGMPGEAIQTGVVDFVLPVSEIAPTLVILVMPGKP